MKKEIMKNSLSINDDLDIVNIIEAKDEKLITDEIIYGNKSSIFVYKFDIKKDKKVSGISVAGAEYLARKYGNLKHKIVATSHKMGKKFMLTSYDPLDVKCSIADELAEEDDHYSVVIEITDLRNNNTRQIVKTETRYGVSKYGEVYEKPHYTTIAESKAYRNAILSLVPKDVQETFKAKCIKDGGSKNMTESLIDEKRRKCFEYATDKGILINSKKLESLTWDELAHLSNLAREGVEVFRNSLIEFKLTDAGSTTKCIKKEAQKTMPVRNEEQESSIPSLTDYPNNLSKSKALDEKGDAQMKRVIFK